MAEGDGVRIRQLGPEDLPEVLAVWQEAGLDHRPDGRDEPSRFAAELAETSSTVFGAFAEGELVAVLLLTDDGRKAWINRLAVRPGWRRRGIGRRLMGVAEREIERRGLGLVAALIEDLNAPSRALFEEEGYEVRRDIIYFRKVLKPGW